LSDIGVEATVVGDPALLLAPARPAPGDCVVVCLGFGDDLWGHDHTAVEREVGGAIARLRTAGLRVRFVAVNPEDVPAAASAAAHAGETGCEVHVAATPAEFFSLLDGAAVVVAERLHAAVLAACAGVPFVSLEYQPKCADFAGAVAASARVVRTDRVRAGELAELVIETADDEDSTRRVYAAVEDLRTRLRGEINAIIGAPDCDRLLA
jgi:polysaccharide pyruvyl transferase WcaK-like protein